jgi:branched-chain amino acid transport system substrate-binding protein
MRKGLFFVIFALILISSVLWAGGSKDAPAGGEFVIGAYLQLTGSNAVPGDAARRGIELAIEHINANGGFNGATVKAVYYDTTGSPEEAGKIVRQMLLDRKVNAVIGSINSNECTIVTPIMEQDEILHFGLGTSATWMENKTADFDYSKAKWTFRASANNNRIAPQDVDLIQQLGYKSVAIMNTTDATGKSTADTFEEACKAKGITVGTREECSENDTDFSGQISKIIASNSDCVFMSLIGNIFGPFVKQLRNAGYKGLIGCKECFSPQYMDAAGIENSDYIFFAYPYVTYTDIKDCEIPIMKDFLTNFLKANGALPKHEGAYRGWDTMMSLWQASKIAKSNDKTALRDAMKQVKISGLGGPLDFTKGDREGYSEFYNFMLVRGINFVLDDWLKNNGMAQYKAATGRDR